MGVFNGKRIILISSMESVAIFHGESWGIMGDDAGAMREVSLLKN